MILKILISMEICAMVGMYSLNIWEFQCSFWPSKFKSGCAQHQLSRLLPDVCPFKHLTHAKAEVWLLVSFRWLSFTSSLRTSWKHQPYTVTEPIKYVKSLTMHVCSSKWRIKRWYLITLGIKIPRFVWDRYSFLLLSVMTSYNDDLSDI